MFHRKLFATTALLFAIAPAFAQFDRCLDQFPKAAIPSTQEVGRDLCFDSFAVYYSPSAKKPIYTVEKLNKARLDDAHEERTNVFYEEARLRPAERAHLSDYARSGYDRGHIEKPVKSILFI